MTDAIAAPTPPRSPLLWGVFCACSWTWCIGMYLPVLLIDRFGWNGFLAFAVPNVLGCSVMAFVLARRARWGQTAAPARERSERLCSEHGGMMAAFSLVTVAYQVFFAVWLVSELIAQMSLPQWGPLAVGLVVYALGLLFAFTGDRDWLALAIVTYAISLGAIFSIGSGGFARVPMSGSLPAERLWWLLPTLCFGFGLCPYLDLTFHRAAQVSSQPRVSFVIFGVAFAIMLGLTVMLWFSPSVWYQRVTATAAIGHILAQLIFTIGAHLREVRLSKAFSGGTRRWLWIASPLAAIAALPIGRMRLDEFLAGEWAYLSFLACYGLLFPAYVAIAMASGRRLGSAAGWIAFFALVIACVPLYAKGFLFDQTPWLAPPVALFIVWALLRRRRSRPPLSLAG